MITFASEQITSQLRKIANNKTEYLSNFWDIRYDLQLDRNFTLNIYTYMAVLIVGIPLQQQGKTNFFNLLKNSVDFTKGHMCRRSYLQLQVLPLALLSTFLIMTIATYSIDRCAKLGPKKSRPNTPWPDYFFFVIEINFLLLGP